ncbi:hypothetical protein Mapa_004860 [Marchantia paleacea]|nr:hypothetical protein Mapa_004860 [Marchantia paleacea]
MSPHSLARPVTNRPPWGMLDLTGRRRLSFPFCCFCSFRFSGELDADVPNS